MLAELASSQPNVLAYAARVSDAAAACAARVVAQHPGAPELAASELVRAEGGAPGAVPPIDDLLEGLGAEEASAVRRVAGAVAGALEAARLPTWSARLPRWLRPRRPDRMKDRAWDVPTRLPWKLWAVGFVLFVSVYYLNFGYVHVVADTRACGMRLDDPLFKLISHDDRWGWVTVNLYTDVTLATLALLLGSALFLDERPMVRYGMGLAFMCFQRDLAILLVPLCRATRMPGSVVLDHIPYLNLGFAKIPWNMFASNDLLVSGHVAEFLLMLRATRGWPKVLRAALWASLGLQIIGLLHGRGHYTIDMILAVPVAYFADAMTVLVIRGMTGVDRMRSALPSLTTGSVRVVGGGSG